MVFDGEGGCLLVKVWRGGFEYLQRMFVSRLLVRFEVESLILLVYRHW